MKKRQKQAKRSTKKINKWNKGVALLTLALSIIITLSVLGNRQDVKSQAAPAGFVTREGKNLMLNGAVYKFVGFNAYGMTGCYPRAWTQEEIDAYFQSLPTASMTRIWAFEKQKDNLDLVVTRAEANGQKFLHRLPVCIKFSYHWLHHIGQKRK